MTAPRKLLLCALLLTASTTFAPALEDPPRRELPPAHLRTDKEIKTAVVKGLLANPYVSAAAVRVEVHKRTVTLRGTVRDRQEKMMAEEVTAAVRGVRKVNNQLVIRRPRR